MEGDDDRERDPDIEDAESLDGLTVFEAFVLGYELADVEHQILDGKPFMRQLRAENRVRVARCCQNLKRKFSMGWISGDQTESWLELMVEGK